MHASVQAINPVGAQRSLRTPLVTYFVRGDGTLRRVRAVRCDTIGSPQTPSVGAPAPEPPQRHLAATQQAQGPEIQEPDAGDAEELRTLRAMGWRIEEPDAASDASLRAICDYAVIAGAQDPASRRATLEEKLKVHVWRGRGEIKRRRVERGDAQLATGTLVTVSNMCTVRHQVTPVATARHTDVGAAMRRRQVCSSKPCPKLAPGVR